MPFVENILKHPSLSIVGLEKNTGKTVCLNYLLKRLSDMGIRTAVTSIGVDGEQVDSVFATAKPEVTLYEGMRFITSEKHYAQRQLVSKIMAADERRTSLGRLVTAEVVCTGRAMLSGAATTAMLKEQIEQFKRSDITLSVVDGALSRLSLASPTVTDTMILATGAAVSVNLRQLIARTRFVHSLILLPEVDAALQARLSPIVSGLWGVDNDGMPHDLGIASVFLIAKSQGNLFRYGNTLYASGAVSDMLIKKLAALPNVKDITLIARDFTKCFFTPEAYADFTRKGGRLLVLQRSRLAAICFNPTSPQGFTLNSEETCKALAEALETPVFDVMREAAARHFAHNIIKGSATQTNS